MAPSDNTKLSPMAVCWHSKSLSSINSDAATFHSAQAHGSHIELETQTPPSTTISKPSTPHPSSSSPLAQAPKPDNIKMECQDSGYEEGIEPFPLSPPRRSSHPRAPSTISSSSTRRRCSSKRNASSSTSTSSNRPTHKRAARSSSSAPRMSTSSRPSLGKRYTNPQPTPNTYQFFQFPSLTPHDSTATTDPCPSTTTPPPTTQYWTSDSTRRLEYAAIDAASKGLRGFVIKLIPDCFLPAGSRRPRFYGGEGREDGDSDVGSVRRYRLWLPEEKEQSTVDEVAFGGKDKRPAILRRWTSFGGKRK